MQVNVNQQNFLFLEAISSKTRIKIIEILNTKPLNIKEIAESLSISSAIVTKHIHKLEEAGIVQCYAVTGKRGTQKVCSLLLKQAVLNFQTEEQEQNLYSFSIPVGQYISFDIQPTCGLCSTTGIIGMMDDPRYFADPEHTKASHLWFGSGWVRYQLPNFLLNGQQMKQLQLSFEICSEAPGYNEHWPSDISFFVNETELGSWTCPGDYGKDQGVYTPAWWKQESHSQYGLLKTIKINSEGTFLDGVTLSNIRIDDLQLSPHQKIDFTIAAPLTAEHCGGVSLFGKGFGNYDVDIEVKMYY